MREKRRTSLFNLKGDRDMRILFVWASLAMVGACAILATPALGQPVALTGKMQPFTYLLGTPPWNCTTNVPAMGNQPARTDTGSAVFEVAPGNVVRNHVTTPNYSGDFYFGYDPKTSMYWQVSADNMGGHGFLASTDGKNYTGTASMGSMTAQSSVTYNRVSPNNVTVHEVITAGSQSETFDSTCTR